METDRFEALVDAVIAIIITIIVLEIPMAPNGSWSSLSDLHLEFISYTISFVVCFNYWNFHNNLFSIVNKINYKVIWSSGISLFVLSLLPYLTNFVANNFYSILAQSLYGIDFIITNLIFIFIVKNLKETDKANIALQLKLNESKKFKINFLIFAISFC